MTKLFMRRILRIPPGIRKALPRNFATVHTTYEDEKVLAELRRKLKTQSAFAPPTDMSPEVRAKFDKEIDNFLQEFVFDVDLSKEYEDHVASTLSRSSGLEALESPLYSVDDEDGNVAGSRRFPNLKQTEFDEPYSEQELFVRLAFHANRAAGLGARPGANVYRPHEDIHRPPSVYNTSVATLVAAGAHLGHNTSRVRANCLPYIEGTRQGIHIIDLEQTQTALRRVSRVAQGISEKGGIILFVGTRENQKQAVESAAERCKGYYVHTRWIPGTLTNSKMISGSWERTELNMGDQTTGRNLDQHLKQTIVKPDLVVILNPVENRNLLNECIAMRVPTTGVIDTDSEPTLVTYPIPGNDDSRRFTDLVAGVLSRAAQRGRSNRLGDFVSYTSAKGVAKSGEGFNKPESANSTKDPALKGLSDSEVELARSS